MSTKSSSGSFVELLLEWRSSQDNASVESEMRKFGPIKTLYNFRDQDNVFEVDCRIEVFVEKFYQTWFTLLFQREDQTYGAGFVT
jgi:hypothetical protein